MKRCHLWSFHLKLALSWLKHPCWRWITCNYNRHGLTPFWFIHMFTTLCAFRQSMKLLHSERLSSGGHSINAGLWLLECEHNYCNSQIYQWVKKWLFFPTYAFLGSFKTSESKLSEKFEEMGRKGSPFLQCIHIFGVLKTYFKKKIVKGEGQ